MQTESFGNIIGGPPNYGADEPSRNGEESRFCGSYKIYYPDGRLMPHEECPMARALRGEKLKAEDLEIIVERPDGERRHVIPAPRILTNIHGKITGAINSLFDITERKRAETAAMRLAAVVQSSHDAVAAKTLNGIITDWNQSAERIFGYKPKEIIGKSVLTLIPKDRQDEEHEILRRIRRGESLDHYETVRRRKDGQLIDVSLTISPIKSPKGETVGVSKIARDITKQKETERRLTEQARLLELTNDAIIVRDKNERITYWNKGATKLYGYTRQEALGTVIQHLLKSKLPEPLSKIYEKLLRDNHWQGEIVHTRHDGRRIIVFSRWALDRDAQGNRAYVLETNNDITERKRAEQRQTVNLAVTKILAESPALTYAVPRILQNVCETLGWEAGAFWAHDPEADVLRCLTGWERHPGRFLKFKKICSELTLARGAGLPGLVWNSGKPTWISDINDTDFPRARVAVADGLHATFAFPISYRKRFLAVMECFSCEIREPDEELLKVFASVGSQIGQFIQRKEAEGALQKSKELLEQRVRQRTGELRAANRAMKDEIARRKGLEGEILEISDREQQRLGQELHDGLCQHLTAVAFMARSVGLRLKNHRVIEVADIEKIAQLVNDAATDTRNLSRALHRIDVDAAGLVDALRDLVDREIWRIPCRLEFKPSFHVENDIAAGELYRIAREAVINANKHSQARKIVIRLEGVEKEMVLRVIDDGTGFPSEPKTKRGLGAHIMSYRARLIGARLEIDTPKEGGTRVSCYLPNNALQSHERKNAKMRSFPAKITKALAALI